MSCREHYSEWGNTHSLYDVIKRNYDNFLYNTVEIMDDDKVMWRFRMKFFKIVVEGVRCLPCGKLTTLYKHGKWISGLYQFDDAEPISFSQSMVEELEAQLDAIKDKFISHSKRCYGRMAVTKIIVYNEDLEKLATSKLLLEVNRLQQLKLSINTEPVEA